MSKSSVVRSIVVLVGLYSLLLANSIGQKWRQSGPFVLRPGEPDTAFRSQNTGGVNSPAQIRQVPPPIADQRRVTDRENAAIGRYLAKRLLAGSESELEISQLASGRAEDPEIRQYAEQAVREHRDLAQQLRPLAAAQVGSLVRGDRQSPTTAPSDVPPVATRGLWNSAPDAAEVIDRLSDIERVIHMESAEAVRQKLDQKTGRDFDQAYLSQLVSEQIDFLTALDVIARQPNLGPLRLIARAAFDTTQQHLRIADRLIDRDRVGRQRTESTTR
jgi:predicted outer membrane protein